jgi:hypothetical protein
MHLKQNKGSILLLTLTFVSILAIASGALLSLSSNTYKLSMRNQYRAEARVVAESEMEYVLNRFKTAVAGGSSARTAFNSILDIADNGATPNDAAAPRATFLQTHQAAGWTVRRSIQLFASVRGRVPDTNKTGQFTYINAMIEVLPPSGKSFANIEPVRVGRRFINSNATIFQNSIFFQGDMELNPGNDTVITGNVSANGSIYMGPRSGKTLKIDGTVRFLDYLNADATHESGVFSNPNAPTPSVTLVAPTFSPTGTTEKLQAPENLFNGVDATAVALARPDLFGPQLRDDSAVWTPAELEKAKNNVYRSLIAPPPSVASLSELPNGNSETPDDPGISAARAYNKSGLIIQVSSNNAVIISKVEGGVTTNVTSTYKDFVSKTANAWDEREGKLVKVNTINLGALGTKIMVDYPTFNGLLYVNLQNSTSASPAAIKITNAATLPVLNTGPTTETIKGLSIATNGGIYIQGSFNTTAIPGTKRNIPAMLMGDAITVLSSKYNDANAHRPLTARVAKMSDAESAAGGMTINAGLLTGNVAASGPIGKSSGGAQNLVRYQEDWTDKNVNFNGSIGRLFQSTQFTQPFTGPGEIYNQPSNRVFTFDANMQSYPPPGNPTTTAFSRGTFLTWSR